MENPWLQYTGEDWDAFRDPKTPWTTKLTRAVKGLMLCGCLHSDEPTLGCMLALLLNVRYAELPPTSGMYSKLQELKTCVAVEQKPYPFGQIKDFPTSPKELPGDVFGFAYSQGAPVTVDLPGIYVIVERNPLRNNSKLLRARPSPKVQADIKKDLDFLKQITFGQGEDEESSFVIATTDREVCQS